MAKRNAKSSNKPAKPARGDAPLLDSGLPADAYRHAATRKNNPPAKIAAEGTVPAIPRAQYAYNPHLPPVLRFDQSGGPDALPTLLEKARRSPLTDDEARLLADALRRQEPWLEWTGKREAKSFEVDPVALHIHERISTQAILKVAARQDVQRSLFADPQQEYHEAVQFYRHDVDWANRLILGDSLAVMSSLARREDLAGKVQMIYIDPPYGIKFASNFQPEVGRRDVKDKEQDLTREPEMVRAYRDTWHLGIHSYLSYLRDRLIVARELLADTGSIFVQIGEENLHLVQRLLCDVFGTENFCAQINLKKSSGLGGNLLPAVCDYLLWFARDRSGVRFRPLFRPKGSGQESIGRYDLFRVPSGEIRRQGGEDLTELPADAEPFSVSDPTAQGFRPNTTIDFDFQGQTFHPGANRCWRTVAAGMRRLDLAGRLLVTGSGISYLRKLADYPVFERNNVWDDVGGIMSRSDPKVYVVQTSATIIERCMLMTTDPGDLVLDPTCGSGTTAYVAEQWGRRWITIDTSRVAIAIARQRLLTAKYDMYRTRATKPRSDEATKGGNPADGFLYKTVPHITLKSIAQNTALDPIFARHEPRLAAALERANAALAGVTPEIRAKLAAKLARKEREEGKRAVTDADRRRWELPGEATKPRSDGATKGPEGSNPKSKIQNPKFEHWTVPFDTDADWPRELQEAVTAYRAAWRAKMDEVNACIAASAEQEELVDQPEIVRGIVRVSGPFTVEAVQPPEMTLGDNVDPYTGSDEATERRSDAGADGGGMF